MAISVHSASTDLMEGVDTHYARWLMNTHYIGCSKAKIPTDMYGWIVQVTCIKQTAVCSVQYIT